MSVYLSFFPHLQIVNCFCLFRDLEIPLFFLAFFRPSTALPLLQLLLTMAHANPFSLNHTHYHTEGGPSVQRYVGPPAQTYTAFSGEGVRMGQGPVKSTSGNESEAERRERVRQATLARMGGGGGGAGAGTGTASLS